MATAAVAKEVKKKKTSKRAYVELWKLWKDGGNAPATRQAALRVLARHIRGLGSPAFLLKEFSKLHRAKSRVGAEGEELNDCLSFIVWDLTENKGRAMNYNAASNVFLGLMEQATDLIWGATRITMRVGNTKITIPTMITLPEGGAIRLVDVDAGTLDVIVDQFIRDAKTAISRWTTMGANKTTIRRAVQRLSEEVLAELGD